MPRPKRIRNIDSEPEITWFKPAGVPMRKLEEVNLALDEVEALRLADYEGLYQQQVAERMGVSRQTIGRILTSAHGKIAEALVQGKAIRVDGGPVNLRDGCKRQGPGPCEPSLPSKRRRGSPRSQIGQPTKVAVSAHGPDLDSDIHLRYGRATWFVIVDLASGASESIDNRATAAGPSGAGVTVTQAIADAGADAVIAGQIGPTAARALDAANIAVFHTRQGTVREAIEKLHNGGLAHDA